MIRVIRSVLCQRDPGAVVALRGAFFNRVLIEDTTVISMAKSTAVDFLNNENGRYETAGCKYLFVSDLLSGQPVLSQLHAARDADQSLAFGTVDQCLAGDLLLPDMGFFNTDALRQIGGRKAFWISRLPASVKLVSGDGSTLADLLKNTRFDHVDQVVLLGREQLGGGKP